MFGRDKITEARSGGGNGSDRSEVCRVSLFLGLLCGTLASSLEAGDLSQGVSSVKNRSGAIWSSLRL
jgi:hypothetical protein